jgi:hypothetical protein
MRALGVSGYLACGNVLHLLRNLQSEELLRRDLWAAVAVLERSRERLVRLNGDPLVKVG